MFRIIQLLILPTLGFAFYGGMMMPMGGMGFGWPMSGYGMMGGMGYGGYGGYGFGGYPLYGSMMYGTGSPWAAGGGLVGNALSFLVG
ncbi:unnamed protein product [Cylicocyclus nassatus]|uniref:Uncharacterized protein n=1 Tax=Cylicocyclus nassatus TaxID=53992 RepID=A0AA36DRJ7_CYLNA|nr:unnamed protein product [Cylicocyclus nassatus]